MGEVVLTFFKWFFVTTVIALVAGAVAAAMIGTDFESSRRIGEAIGRAGVPVIFVVTLAGTFFSLSRASKQREQEFSKGRISDLYQ